MGERNPAGEEERSQRMVRDRRGMTAEIIASSVPNASLEFPSVPMEGAPALEVTLSTLARMVTTRVSLDGSERCLIVGSSPKPVLSNAAAEECAPPLLQFEAGTCLFRIGCCRRLAAKGNRWGVHDPDAKWSSSLGRNATSPRCLGAGETQPAGEASAAGIRKPHESCSGTVIASGKSVTSP